MSAPKLTDYERRWGEPDCGLPESHPLHPRHDGKRFKATAPSRLDVAGADVTDYGARADDLERRMRAGLAAMIATSKGTPHEALIMGVALRAATASRQARARAMTGKVTSQRDRYYVRIAESRAAGDAINAAVRDQRLECEDDAGAEAVRRAFYARAQAMGSDITYEDVELLAAQWRAEVEAFRMQHVCGVECGGLCCDDGEAGR